jgi:hypothetical protein
MIAFLLSIPSRIKLWLAAIVAVFAAFGAVYAKGRADAKAKRDVKDLTEHKATVEKVLHETPSDDPAADIRKRLRDRAR